jgi:ADP-ribose pyrophosphatase
MPGLRGNASAPPGSHPCLEMKGLRVNEDELLLQTRKFAVRRRQVSAADGGLRPYDFVVHPGAAVILPILADGRVVLIANYRVVLERELLELPAGTLDPPEQPIECARRELAEETGYEAGRIEPLVSFYSSPGICTEHLHAFVATGLTPGPTRHEPGERIRLVPLSWVETLAAIRQQRIVDGKSIVALLYYDRFVRADKDRS